MKTDFSHGPSPPEQVAGSFSKTNSPKAEGRFAARPSVDYYATTIEPSLCVGTEQAILSPRRSARLLESTVVW